MKYALSTLLLVGVAVLGISCGENKPPEPPQQQANLRPNFFSNLSRPQVRYSSNLGNQGDPNSLGGINPARTTAPPHAARTSVPPQPATAIPDDANWTLYVTTVAGPDRFARLQQMKSYLTENTPYKKWYVVHEDQASTLFYGFYASIERNSPTGKNAHIDREQIAKWTDSSGQQPFARCFFVEITPPDPVAPTEWNLANAPARAYWSLQVAAFKGNPKRKEAAVLAVKELRDLGVEAFYHHGPTISSVCVGAWPENAVKKQEDDGSRAKFDEEDAVLVSAEPLPQRYANALNITDRHGSRVRRLSQVVEIADPSLATAMKEYPDHITNYNRMKRTVRGVDNKPKEVFAPSFLVLIPREQNAGFNEYAWPGQQPNSNNPNNPNRPADRPTFDNTPAGGTRLPGLR